MLGEMIAIARESTSNPAYPYLHDSDVRAVRVDGLSDAHARHRAGYPLSLALGLFTLSQVAAIFGRLSWGALSDYLFR